MATESAIVFGAGAGLGAAIVHRFRQGGLKTVAVSRNAENLKSRFAATPDVLCNAADATDAAAVAAAIEQAENEAGPLAAAVANSAAWKIGPLLDHTPEEFEAVWKQASLSSFNILHHAGKRMAERGAGSILFTGSAAQMRAAAGFGPMAAAKLGLRALVQAGARELGPKGVHVGHVVVDGPIASDRTRANYSDHSKLIDPAGIAEAFWFLHSQPKSAWTNEIDIRTASEWPVG